MAGVPAADGELGQARALVGLSRDLVGFPTMAAALEQGAISVGHLRVLTRAVRPLPAELVAQADADLATHARALDAESFRVAVATWVAHAAPAHADKAERRWIDRRHFRLAQTFDQVWHLEGLLDPEGGARLKLALEARAARAGIHDERTSDQRWADALVSLADEALAHAESPAGYPGPARRPEIVVHATAETFAPNPADTGETSGRAVFDDGSPLVRGALERIACDARWRRLLLDAVRVPVDYGRATRDWPASLRKLVTLRDGGCRYPGCPMPTRACEIHHCVHWSSSSPTAPPSGPDRAARPSPADPEDPRSWCSAEH